MLRHRRLLLIGLTFALMARATHCLYVDARLCAIAAASQNEDQPLSDPREADPNETGCICKGVIPGPGCAVPAPTSHATMVIDPGHSHGHLLADVSAANLRPPANRAHSADFGKRLRALLNSWQV